MISVKWWDKFRERTFDKWAKEAEVTFPEVEGVDYVMKGKAKLYTWDEKRNEKFSDWLEESKTNKPLRYFFYYALPEFLEWYVIEGPLRLYNNVHSFFYYRFKRKRHVIPVELEPGWYDTDYLMARSTWKLLFQFMEEEAGHVRWSDYDENERTQQERIKEYFAFYTSPEGGNSEQGRKHMQTLYDAYIWKRNVYPKLKKELNDLYSNYSKRVADRPKGFHDKLRKLENKIRKTEDKHLINIIKHRGFLWT